RLFRLRRVRNLETRTPRLSRAVLRAHVEHFHLVNLLHRVLDLGLVRTVMHFEAVRAAVVLRTRLRLVRTLFRNQGPNDRVIDIHYLAALAVPAVLAFPPAVSRKCANAS